MTRSHIYHSRGSKIQRMLDGVSGSDKDECTVNLYISQLSKQLNFSLNNSTCDITESMDTYRMRKMQKIRDYECLSW